MKKEKIYLGENEIKTAHAEVSGQIVEIDGEKYYQIKNYHEMPDFFISVVSDSNHWMFISSTGSLSAGRKDRENALFPYYTDDKIHDYKGITGSKSIFLIDKNGKKFLWEPFSYHSQKFYNISTCLYKSIYGNNIIFEETNTDLGLNFRYGWYNSEKFGFVKKSSLINLNQANCNIEILDGLQNIIPHGVGYTFQNEYSNLSDAYKKSELIEGTTLGLYMLSAIPVDRAEPSEALKASTVWSLGFGKQSQILISDKQVENFKNGFGLEPEYDIRAKRGAYFIHANVDLTQNKKQEWFTVAEINQSSTDVGNLSHFISNTPGIAALIEKDILQGTFNLKKMVAFADGFQITNTDLCYARHFTNTLFNILRGGIYINNYTIDNQDYKKYVWQINRLVASGYQTWLENIPTDISNNALIDLAKKNGNADLLRITLEYLPLTFSRRHGDPSRPWNMFSIETKNDDGSIKYYYAGNWRDIFQNWEALCYSYPDFIEGIIAKFVNASTIDGYNPYRIMRDGIDWESPDPHDPWAYIGYWGDHQIIYLEKLLELSNNFHPGKLDFWLTNKIFTYANVPYRIKSYENIYKDPKNTVDFDDELNTKIKAEAEYMGADAKLLKNKSGENIYKVNLSEKILATLLSKLSNFIPEAGIWMNTQRPEWNDANNALVGNGTSMVTLYYLRRFLKFWDDKLDSSKIESVNVSVEIAELFENIQGFLHENAPLLEKGFSNTDRKKFADHLGNAHSVYRNKIYTHSFSGKTKELTVKNLVDFFKLCLKYMDQSIVANKRADGLYHAYNLISLNDDNISIRHLYEMLEGQVAVLSSGFLSTTESLEVLDALKKSQIYRADQYSYMLYPDRQLPRFMDKNTIPPEAVKSSPLLTKLIEDNEPTIIQKDDSGQYHFNSEFRNADVLASALESLANSEYHHLILKEKKEILAIYEEVFDHQSFTGRSGTFFGYEGLGSIYWHMVSKLLLSTQEYYFRAIEEGAAPSVIGQLKDHYYEIKAGIGLYKKPDLYGSFPTDAYSHTPANAGVKQPGLTGQVKEDIISRIGEMGVIIQKGIITFKPHLLNHEEILDKEGVFEYFSLKGEARQISLNKNQIGFTICQVPVVYNFTNKDKISVEYENSTSAYLNGNSLDEQISHSIFSRSGNIKQVNVSINTPNYV